MNAPPQSKVVSPFTVFARFVYGFRSTLRRPLCGLAVACMLSAPAAPDARAQSGTTYLSGLNLDYLTHQSGMLYWKSGCIIGIEPPGIIQRVPAGGSAVATYFAPPACDGSSVRSINLAADGTRRVFWATPDGRIVSLDALATPASTPVTLTTMADPSALFVHVAASAAYVYWAETTGELGETGMIYRVPIDGGVRETVRSLTDGAGGATALYPLGPTSADGETIVYKRANGKLQQATNQFINGTWTASTIVNSSDVFTVVGRRLYYAETVFGGATTIRSRNLTGLAFPATHATLSTGEAPLVTDIEADASAVYWFESRTGTGQIWRQMFSGGVPEPITENIILHNNLPLFLVSDGRALYWRASGTEIRTLPVNAGAIVFDIEARAMEVVQTIQSPLNDVPLVADKPVWVRCFGKFSVTNASTTRLERMPIVHLHGSRNGVAMPGSPLQPTGGDSVLLTTDADRTRTNTGAWFRLPLEWTTAGGLQLRADYNAERVLHETDYTNNDVTLTATFQARRSILLRAYPLRTTAGTIGSYKSYYQPLFDLAEALLPTPELSVSFGGWTLEEWNPPLPWDFGPYELSKSDDDSGWIMFKLGQRAVLNYPFTSSSTHFMSFFPPFENRAFNGLGTTAGPKLLLSYMALYDGVSNFNRPLGGVTLAHEIAHNYGRKHVDCGGPSGIDTNYPYDDCEIAGAVPYQGWNPIAFRVIRGTDAGDLLSYRGNAGELGQRWTSDYTWRALFNKLEPLIPPPAPRGPRGGQISLLLLGGVIHAGGAAELSPALRLPDAQAEASASELIAGADDATSWSFVLRRSNGTLLTTVPAAATHTTDDGPVLVHAMMPENTEAASVTLVKNSAPAVPQATLAGGGAPPTLSIIAPTAGTVAGASLTIRWAASDPEGQPLHFQVRHSNDHGATWQVLADDVRLNDLTVTPAELPGGAANQAQIEVLASDGLRTTTAKSAFFTIAAKLPAPLIVVESERGRSCGAALSIPSGEQITLRGSASDSEDLTIPGAALAWSVTGPNGFTRTATGRELLLRDLAPGNYSADLRATDSSAKTATVTESFSVRPVAVSDSLATPVLDGYGDDPAYLDCRHPLMLRYPDGTAATVRTITSGGSLYVMMTGLLSGAATPGDFAGLAFDPNHSRDSAVMTADRRFQVSRNGAITAASGDGAGGFSNPVFTGFDARVTGNGTRWAAEFVIPLATLGVSAGQTIGMDTGHYSRTAAGDDTHWFAGAVDSWNRPARWASVRLGADPDDPADIDFDDMADAWETAFLGSTSRDGTGDADGDGQSDASEYQSATDPADRASRFVITGLAREGDAFRLTWPGVTGCLYEVQASSDLIAFEPVCENLAGTGAALSCLINPGMAGERRYFRVAAKRCPQ